MSAATALRTTKKDTEKHLMAEGSIGCSCISLYSPGLAGLIADFKHSIHWRCMAGAAPEVAALQYKLAFAADDIESNIQSLL